MKDRFEEFVQMHRDEFDEHEPPEHVWGSVHKKLHNKKVQYYSTIPALAASVLLIVGSFVWFNGQTLQKVNTNVAAVTPLSPEIKEAETYYAGVIDEQSKELEQYKSRYPDLYNDFEVELKSLNNYCSALKEEYATSANKEIITQSIIENLQTQVQITERQLEIVRAINNKNNNKATS